MNVSRRFCAIPYRTQRARPPTATPEMESWWPWAPSLEGQASCPESAVLFDALQRRLTITGMLRACCVQKLTRVFDFVLAISPGDTSIDVTAVTELDAPVALVLRDWKDVLAARHLRLSIVGASPAVVHALGF